MLKLSDVMTKDVITLGPDLTVREAMAVLTDRRVSGAPVVENNKVVGVVSTSDLLQFAAENVDTEQDSEYDDGRQPDPTWDGLTPPEVEEDDPTAALYFAMLDDSEDDVWEKMEEARGEELSELDDRTVGDIMTTKLITMSTDDTITDAADYMRTMHVHRLLVVDARGELAGLVTTMDLAREVADERVGNRGARTDRPNDRSEPRPGA
ncbi:MAG TPA: CBS domain-containing protein [Gemmatimonadaceae bacterium]|nr:CBS domain-containing protein [Gemmatimonadaceae bacterium]